MLDDIIICCAITGGGDTVRKNPAVPVTPQQIADSAIDAANAGAAIVHLHVRDPETGRPSMELRLYSEAFARIRDSGVDVLINLTTGAGARFIPSMVETGKAEPGTTLTTPAERVRHVMELKPDICSLDMGTMNMGNFAFVNTPDHLRAMAKAVGEVGVLPELEVFEAGHVRLATALMREGLLQGPGLFQICLGIAWTQPATTAAMSYMLSLLPTGANWFAFGTGITQFPMAAQSILLGGHVRVGLEDNLYLEAGVLAPSNAALVERAVEIVRALGARVASPAKTRQILGLP
jgi:uncharacterized protein (DUF849 family)